MPRFHGRASIKEESALQGPQEQIWVDGREAVVVWDGRPEHQYVKVRWERDGTDSDLIPAEDICAKGPPQDKVEVAKERRKKAPASLPQGGEVAKESSSDVMATAQAAGSTPPPRLSISSSCPISMEVMAAEAKANGNAAFLAKDFEEALKYFTDAHTLDPSDALTQQLLELSLMCIWEGQSIPVFSMADYNAAAQVAQQIQRSKSDAKTNGNKAFHAGRFEEAAVQFTEVVKRSPSDNISRKLLEASHMHAWEKQGIPVLRLGNYKAAKQLVDNVTKIEAQSLDELKDSYKVFGLPVEKQMSRDELERLLKKVAIWQVLPLPELQIDCSQRGVPSNITFIGQDHRQQKHLAKTLLLQERMDEWEKRGLQAKRLGDVYTVIELLQACEKLEDLDLKELQEWYLELGFPLERCLSKTGLVQIRKKLLFWQKLSSAELVKECENYSLPLPADMPSEPREEDVNTMLWGLLVQGRMEAWEAKGLPVKKLQNVETAAAVIGEIEHGESLTLDQLKEWYSGLGLPAESHMASSDYVDLFRKLAVWRELPIPELRKECSSIITGIDATVAKGDEKEQRNEYMVKLMQQDCMNRWDKRGLQVKRLGGFDEATRLVSVVEYNEQVSLEELRTWYRELNLPGESISLIDMKGLLQFKQSFDLWCLLPTSELTVECRKHRLNFMKMCGVTDQQREEMLEQLIIQRCKEMWEKKGIPSKRLGDFTTIVHVLKSFHGFEAMSDNEAQKAYAEMGIGGQKLDRIQIIKLLKTVVVWESLPVRELEKECHERGLPPLRIGKVRKLLPSTADDAERHDALLHVLKVDLVMNAAFASEPDHSAGSETGLPASCVSLESGEAIMPDSTNEQADSQDLANDTKPVTEVQFMSILDNIEHQKEEPEALMDWYEREEGETVCEDCAKSDSGASIPDLLGVNDSDELRT